MCNPVTRVENMMKWLYESSKGNFNLLGSGVTGLVTIGVIAAVGAIVLGQMFNLTTTGGTLANADAATAITNALSGVVSMTTLLPVLGIVIIAAVVINVLGLFGQQR